MAGITATIWLRERYQRLYGKVRVAVEVLIIRLSALGDVVHALPVAALLKRQIPGARITWIVEPAAAQLLQDNEAVDEVLIFPGKAFLRALNPFHWQAEMVAEGGRFMLNIAGALKDIERYRGQLQPGMRALFNVQDEFEVEGILDYDEEKEMWLGRPDWDTRRDL